MADTAIKSKQLGSPLVETDYDHVHVRGKHSTQNYELLKQSQIVFCSQDKFVASSFNQYNCETSCCVIVVFFVNFWMLKEHCTCSSQILSNGNAHTD